MRWMRKSWVARLGVVTGFILCTCLPLAGEGTPSISGQSDLSPRPLLLPSVWEFSAPLIAPEVRKENPSRAQKDPTVVEENGRRYFKVYVADRLDGAWRPVADTAEKPFAGWTNIRPAPGVAPWTDNVSHGELIRDGYDQTLTVDPADLRFVFQGMLESHKSGVGYGDFSWRIGMLTPMAMRDLNLPGLVQSAIGVTRDGTPIPCIVSTEDPDIESDRTRLLLIGGLDGSGDSIRPIQEALRWFHDDPGAADLRGRYRLAAVPCVYPDRAAADTPRDRSGPVVPDGYPPAGVPYQSETNPEAQYLWRWIGMHAPDWVVDLRVGPRDHWQVGALNPDDARVDVAAALGAARDLAPDSLVAALAVGAPGGTGPIPAVRITFRDAGEDAVSRFLRTIDREKIALPSSARLALQARLRRSASSVASQLAAHYGHDLKSVVYQPALSLVARARLSELTGNPIHLRDVKQIIAPYVNGAKDSIGERVSGSHLAGHLVFGELARMTGDPAYIEPVRRAADHGFEPGEAPRESMPFHHEMSDSVFMGCPILAQAGVLTGERRYHDLCLAHLKFMQSHCLRADGLYRHSPLNDAAWGRGNGFPALGLAWTLSWVPDDFDGRAVILAAFREHLAALLRYQDHDGMWHQVIDRPESYRELTATCMITFAMTRGLRRGWLDPDPFEPAVEAAWAAIKRRIAPDGSLVDVCTGTGKQASLRAYYDRAAILGRDERGGAMALMAATEIAAWRME